MPIILATQKAEIRSIAVQGLPEIPNVKKGWLSGSSGSAPA
jgi:hypothetical protein